MQNKPNLPDTEMSANFFDKRDYENKPAFAVQKNKANFKRSKPISNPQTACPACHAFMSQLCKTKPILLRPETMQPALPQGFMQTNRPAPLEKTNPIKPNSPAPNK